MDFVVTKGAVNQVRRIFIEDARTGNGLTGLAFNTTGLACYRSRDDDGNAGGTALTLVTAARGTWTSLGFVEKDSVNEPGIYEFGLDNAGIAAGSNSVEYYLQGAQNMVPCVLQVQLSNADLQDGTRLGLTALPNATAGTNLGLPTRTQVLRAAQNFLHVYYVATNGSDANDGLSPDAAWLTINKAVTTAVSGDLVLFGAGTFSSTNKTVPAGVTFRGAGRDSSTLSITTLGGSGLTTSSNVVIENLTISAPSGNCVTCDTGVDILVRNCRLVAGSTGICIQSPTSGTIRALDCELQGSNCQYIIYVLNTATLELARCELVGSAVIGPDVNVTGGTCTLFDCCITSDTTVQLGQSGGTLTVVGCAYNPAKTSGTVTVFGYDTDILSNVVEAAAGGAPVFTVLSVLKQILGMAAGLTSGFPATPNIKNPGGTKTRVSGAADASGNRSTLSWDNS